MHLRAVQRVGGSAMCNQIASHTHGHFEPAAFGRFKPIGRRTFLAQAGRGTFAVLSELSIMRNTLAIAIGSSALVACAAPGSPAQPKSTLPAAEQKAGDVPAVPPAASKDGVSYNRVSLGFVNAYVLVRGKEIAVVDTGVQGSESAIADVIRSIGGSWADVRHVILTHHHPDHAGSMAAVMAAASKATAYIGEADLAQIGGGLTLSGLKDGADVFGLRVIGTPGHTAGHIAIYDAQNAVLIAGDALNNNGVLSGPNPQYSADMQEANRSVAKLGALAFETLYVGHGGPLTSGASAAVAELAKTLK
jgi:glyoxylase-like metal-dependent hydrolase (beta-lactamase superfamily II)